MVNVFDRWEQNFTLQRSKIPMTTIVRRYKQLGLNMDLLNHFTCGGRQSVIVESGVASQKMYHRKHSISGRKYHSEKTLPEVVIPVNILLFRFGALFHTICIEKDSTIHGLEDQI